MYKLLPSSRGGDDLSIGFDRDRKRRQRETTKNIDPKRRYHVGNLLRDIFGFIEHQERETFRLGYKLTLTTSTDNAVLK